MKVGATVLDIFLMKFIPQYTIFNNLISQINCIFSKIKSAGSWAGGAEEIKD